MAEAFPAPEYGPYPCQVEVPVTTNGLAKLATRGALPGGCSAVLELGIGAEHGSGRSRCLESITKHEDGVGQLQDVAAHHNQEEEGAAGEAQAGPAIRQDGDAILEQACGGSEL